MKDVDSNEMALNEILFDSFCIKNTLNMVCRQIEEKQECTEDHMRVLYNLHGETFLKALGLVDDLSVELVTVTNTDRKYFVIHEEGSYHCLYVDLLFCRCDIFKDIVKKNSNNLCHHILAAKLAGSLKRYTCSSSPNFLQAVNES